MVAQVAHAARAHTLNEDALKLSLSAIAQRSHSGEDDIKRAL